YFVVSLTQVAELRRRRPAPTPSPRGSVLDVALFPPSRRLRRLPLSQSPLREHAPLRIFQFTLLLAPLLVPLRVDDPLVLRLGKAKQIRDDLPHKFRTPQVLLVEPPEALSTPLLQGIGPFLPLLPVVGPELPVRGHPLFESFEAVRLPRRFFGFLNEEGVGLAAGDGLPPLLLLALDHGEDGLGHGFYSVVLCWLGS
ncbi:unnamed protein product, partial [Pelagomonas calceolata]